MPARVPVLAVLVAHDGSRWLPTALSALASSTVTPSRVVAVDTGSTDGSADLLRRALDDVLELPRTTSYAAAVAAAVASVPETPDWVWLLHDDCAPDPGTLAVLLRAAAADPSAAVLGPRVVDWDDPRVLVEIGCSTDVLGARRTFVEPGEPDQGQYEQPRPVLAVGTAGALVRRDVWRALDGLEPDLPLREDLDLGWRARAAGGQVLVVPAARIRHARAVTTGRRALDSARRTPSAVERRSAHRLLLAHARPLGVAALLPLIAVAAVLRALGLLLVRRPTEAYDELRAVALPPGGLRRSRGGGLPRGLLPSVASRWRAAASRLVDRERSLPSLRSPLLPLVLALAVTSLVATRELLGRGALSGGRLLPAPEGALGLWRAYARTADPALGVLAVPATVIGGQAAVELLLLGSVPLSGAAAAAVASRVVDSRLLQLWAGATWAVLPVATGAVATGQLGAAAVHVALPPLLLLGHRVLTGSRPWALGLALTPVAAMAPEIALLTAVLLLGAAAVLPGRRRDCLVAAVVPFLLLLPWSPDLLQRAGATGVVAPTLPAYDLLLLAPGGPGTPAALLTLPLLVGALAGLLRTRRARVAAAGWGLALVGLAAALLLVRLGSGRWPGVPLDLAAAGMLLSALVGAEGLQRSLSRAAFGWRQLAAVVLVVAAAAVPVVLAADWVRRGADGPVQRVDPTPLPAFAAAELEHTGLRALLLDERPDGVVGYAVTGAAGARLGDEPARLDPLVTALMGPPQSPAVHAAARAGVAFVAAPPALAEALDAQPGFDREPTADVPLWRVAATPAEPPAPSDALGPIALALQALAVLVAAVLAAPERRP